MMTVVLTISESFVVDSDNDGIDDISDDCPLDQLKIIMDFQDH